MDSPILIFTLESDDGEAQVVAATFAEACKMLGWQPDATRIVSEREQSGVVLTKKLKNPSFNEYLTFTC